MCELFDQFRPKFDKRGREVFSVDGGSVVQKYAQRRPLRSAHFWSGGFVDDLACLGDGFGKCLSSGSISIVDVGRARFRCTGLGGSEALRAPTRSLSELLQRFNLHVIKLLQVAWLRVGKAVNSNRRRRPVPNETTW